MSANKFRYLFIIDDDNIQLEMMKDYLSARYLFEIRTYQTGEDALKDMHLQPEIIVLDYFLNSKQSQAADGIQILKEIKIKSPNSQIIMISGQDNIEVAVDTMQNGAFDYIVKGETAFSRLENTINKLGELHKLQTINKSQKSAIVYLSIGLIVILLYALFFKSK